MKITILSTEKSGDTFPFSIPPKLPGLSLVNSIQADPGNLHCIDLDFDNSPGRIDALEKAFPGIIAVNAVNITLDQFPKRFFRFNGWGGFLDGLLIEASARDEDKKIAEDMFGLLGKRLEWVRDVPGFISPRIVSMIINEAYYALDEKLSSQQEIDTAMKLGTNYPFGPFEWSHKIGLDKIYSLLQKLSVTNKRYLPTPLLEKEAKTKWP